MRFYLGLLASLAVIHPALADQKQDESAVRSVFETFRADWNTPGFPGHEKLLMPGADFVVVTGKWLKGRETIVAYHRDLLKTFYAGAQLTIDDVTVRFVDDTHAVAHVAATVQYTEHGQPIHRPSLATATLDKVNGIWFIDTFQNTITGGPGYMVNFPPALPKKP